MAAFFGRRGFVQAIVDSKTPRAASSSTFNVFNNFQKFWRASFLHFWTCFQREQRARPPPALIRFSLH
jgi:hypothetical protein